MTRTQNPGAAKLELAPFPYWGKIWHSSNVSQLGSTIFATLSLFAQRVGFEEVTWIPHPPN